MDKRITARIFDVTRHNNDTPRFADVITAISEIAAVSDRETQLGEDCHARLERFEERRGILCGEITRIQKTNYPSEVTRRGTKRLDIQGHLGHGVAFCFNTQRSRLAMQYNPLVLSPGRFRDYLSLRFDNAHYELQPVVRNDAWERFRNSPTKKISITVSAPSMVAALENEQGAAADVFRTLGELYDSPVISIEIGVGRRPARLNNRIKEAVRWLRAKQADGTIEVRKLRAVSGDDEDEKIDLLDDILTLKEKLELPDNNPALSYNVRRDWLLEKLRIYGR